MHEWLPAAVASSPAARAVRAHLEPFGMVPLCSWCNSLAWRNLLGPLAASRSVGGFGLARGGEFPSGILLVPRGHTTVRSLSMPPQKQKYAERSSCATINVYGALFTRYRRTAGSAPKYKAELLEEQEPPSA
ncbi:hypothetical protein NDU88_006804 [Pleurodeles waltl]|uniref:Uncharacterized protein n=1 Tax=Pleurodeles waltl TaxID=8319 RepID=A0AAV7NUF1_PLEWA|nr:hypothetical protein NDU88_006804 [Pleurodeles waltl]